MRDGFRVQGFVTPEGLIRKAHDCVELKRFRVRSDKRAMARWKGIIGGLHLFTCPDSVPNIIHGIGVSKSTPGSKPRMWRGRERERTISLKEEEERKRARAIRSAYSA